MTGNEYQKLALRTAPPVQDFEMQLLEGCMGMAGEAGEAVDLLKKYMFQQHSFDRDHMAKELGDVLWYVSLAADAMGFTLDQIMDMNIKKLEARFPELVFDAERSRHRKEGDI